MLNVTEDYSRTCEPVKSSCCDAQREDFNCTTALRMTAFDAIRFCLESCGYAPLRRLGYEIVDDMIVLRGTVSSFYLKQVAQETVRRLGLPQVINNEVRVSGHESQ